MLKLVPMLNLMIKEIWICTPLIIKCIKYLNSSNLELVIQ